MSTDAVRHQWDILADGLDPIIESLEGFDKAVRERMKSLKRLHHSSLSFGGLLITCCGHWVANALAKHQAAVRIQIAPDWMNRRL